MNGNMLFNEIYMEDTKELELLEVDTTDSTTNAAKVILFNDEYHTFDEVINQIIKAVNCSMDRAEALTWEVHTKGKACVFSGDMDKCLLVSNILEEIALRTRIEF